MARRYALPVDRPVVEPRLLNGRYELVEVIGSGGMATVWRAVDRQLDRDVAIKVMDARRATDDAWTRRFAREARHVASLSHPGIVTLFDYGWDGGWAYMVMERVTGRSLRQLLDATGTLPLRATVTLAVDVLGALQHAHSHGIVHRDIKPGNVLITVGGKAKLADFGVARAAPGTMEASLGGVFVGTPSYAAPEQSAGREVSPASDLYSLGCVLYECLTGKPPFSDHDVARLLLQQRFADPTPIDDVCPGLPPGVSAAVMRSLSKEPADRFGSAHEMADVLADRWEPAGTTTMAPATVDVAGGRRPPAPPRGRRRRAVVGLAALSVVLGAGIGAGVLAATSGHAPQGRTAPGRGSLRPGAVLRPHRQLSSTDRAYVLRMEPDGDLEVVQAKTGDELWASGTSGSPGAYAIMQRAGNLVVYPYGAAPPKPGQPTTALWSSGPGGDAGASLRLLDDGNLEILDGRTVVWQSDAVGPELDSGSTLRPGQFLQSPDGRYRLFDDPTSGRLRLATTADPGCVLWEEPGDAKPGGQATMEANGDLVLSRLPGGVEWQSGTFENAGAALWLEDGPVLAVRSGSGATVWQATAVAPSCG